jgi:hypothetical protein
MVRTQLYIFTQNSTLGIQLQVSALYIGHRQVVLTDEISFPPQSPTHILYSCFLRLQYNLTMANIQGRNL